jgi:hypothetical protein
MLFRVILSLQTCLKLPFLSLMILCLVIFGLFGKYFAWKVCFHVMKRCMRVPFDGGKRIRNCSENDFKARGF